MKSVRASRGPLAATRASRPALRLQPLPEPLLRLTRDSVAMPASSGACRAASTHNPRRSQLSAMFAPSFAAPRHFPLRLRSPVLLPSSFCARVAARSPSAAMSSSAPSSRGGRHGRRNNERKPRRGGYGRPSMSQQHADPHAGPQLLRAAPASLPDDAVSVLWLRNDLRLNDNPALALACSAQLMTPLYVFDLTKYGPKNKSPHGFERIGAHRAYFLVGSVEDLTRQLRLRGNDILVRHGEPAAEVLDVVRELADRLKKPVHVVAHKEIAWEEVAEEEAVVDGVRKLSEEMGVPMDVHFLWSSTLHHPHDLPFNPAGPAVPPTFTEYRKLIERGDGLPVHKLTACPEGLPRFPLHLRLRDDRIPSLRVDLKVDNLSDPNDYPFPHPKAVEHFHGGMTAAESRVYDYFWSYQGPEIYKTTRNESGRRNSSTKLSPWLAAGCISPREVYYAVKQFEEKHVANESTYWVIFELMTRDYFRWVSASAGRKLFALNGYSGKDAHTRSVWTLPPGAIKAADRERFRQWTRGLTGAPFIDASMRELANTGFMSNRGRQNVASFLIHDLKFPDWRAGAEYFESKLIDHDVASNWANWAYLAGVGSDPRGGRKFNVIKQSMEYDRDGFFITRWCPELVNLPPPMLHQPHVVSAEELASYRLEAGVHFPKPIVRLPTMPMSPDDILEFANYRTNPEVAEQVRQDFIDAGVEKEMMDIRAPGMD